jgi:hypothetical protein
VENCKKVIVIRNSKNLGVSAAWNQGIEISLQNNCTNLLIVNNDIEFDKSCIDLLISHSKENNNCLTSAYHLTDKNEGYDEGVFWSCFLIHKNIVDSIRYFDENFFPARGEDMDFEWRIDLAGIKHYRFYDCKVKHELNGTAKNLEETNEWKNHNWAGTMGRNLQYYEQKKKRWGY